MKNSALLVLFSITLAFFFPETSEAQLWHRYRHEFFMGAGASQMLGDLGGAPVTAKGLQAVNWGSTNASAMMGYRYKVSPRAALRASMGWMRLSGNDELTENAGRRQRNISVRTTVTEFSPMVEIYLISDDIPKGVKYRGKYFRHRMSGVGVRASLYVATGLTMFYYNPTAQINGEYYNLRDMGTEGQGLRPGSEKYSTIDFALPVNLGLKLNFDRYWSVGLEFGARYTATDYLDDVSTSYYNNDEIREAYGNIAAQLADRRLPNEDGRVVQGSEGGVRGNPGENDAYFYFQFHVSKRFKSYGKSRRSMGARPTF